MHKKVVFNAMPLTMQKIKFNLMIIIVIAVSLLTVIFYAIKCSLMINTASIIIL